MGRSITPAYRIELEGPVYATPMAWQRSYGRPTAANLAKVVETYNDSYGPEGVNAHVGERWGDRARHTAARIVRQRDNEVVAEWATEAPAAEAA